MIPALHNNEARRHQLRWRLEFADHKPDKWGMWDNPGEESDHATKAWANNGENLRLAVIEAKDIRTKEVKRIVECDGQNFCNFQWMAAAVAPVIFKGTAPTRHILWGLKLVTREHNVEVYPDGRAVKSDRTEAEKRIHFATYGR